MENMTITKTKRRKLVKHGLSMHPLYKVWESMNARCYRKTALFFSEYGGRGIDVCEEWRPNVVCFYEWALDHGYKKGLQIDRRDNNKGYSPKNCRFVSSKHNLQNRRDSMFWSVCGVRYNSITDAADALGVSRRTIVRWCSGHVRYGKLYPPKDNCWSKLKYEVSHG